MCFSAKAIHLEAVSDLSTPAFLAALTCFISRRGCPNSRTQSLKWHFIPAGAPHMGGLWKVGVKSVKSHLKKAAGQLKYTYFWRVLYTSLDNWGVFELSSSRSFIQQPRLLRCLTPGHFLVGSTLTAPAEPEELNSPLQLINRWRKIKSMEQHFCSVGRRNTSWSY